MIKISSKREGFRRCGVAHSKAPAEYPDDKFSEEELATLDTEPMLTVEHIIAKTPALEDMTVVALKELLDKMGLAYNMRAPKAVLIETIMANTAVPPAED